jgi:hypothetical protein
MPRLPDSDPVGPASGNGRAIEKLRDRSPSGFRDSLTGPSAAPLRRVAGRTKLDTDIVGLHPPEDTACSSRCRKHLTRVA